MRFQLQGEETVWPRDVGGLPFFRRRLGRPRPLLPLRRLGAAGTTPRKKLGLLATGSNKPGAANRSCATLSGTVYIFLFIYSFLVTQFFDLN